MKQDEIKKFYKLERLLQKLAEEIKEKNKKLKYKLDLLSWIGKQVMANRKRIKVNTRESNIGRDQSTNNEYNIVKI